MEYGQTQKCETCFTGVNTWKYDAFYERDEWSRCNTCNARALNGAQLNDIRRMTEGEGQALIASCVGARKTGTSVGFINRHRGIWLVVAPLHTLDQWADAIDEFSPGTKHTTITTKNKTGLADLQDAGKLTEGRDHVFLIGWEYARRQDWRAFNIDGGILDEVHKMAGFDTMTSKAIRRLNTQYRIGLSGTPANNKLWGLWNVLHWIWWGNNDHKTAVRLPQYKVRHGTMFEPGWVLRHFTIEEQWVNRTTSREVIGREKRFHSVVDEIPLYIQHLEDEACCEWHPKGVNGDLPPLDQPKLIYVDMTATQAKLYKKCDSGSSVLWLDNLAAGLEGADADVPPRKPIFVGDNGLSERMRLRQIALAQVALDPDGKVTMAMDAQSPPADAWLSLAEEIVEPGDPVIVFTWSLVFAKMLVARTNKRFGPGFAVEWSGDVKPELRAQYKRETFGRPGGPQVIVAIITAMGTGTDGLQELCRREVWIGEDDSLTENIQGLGRLRRTGQRRRGQRWYIMSRGTIMESQYTKLQKRKKQLGAALRANPEGWQPVVATPTISILPTVAASDTGMFANSSDVPDIWA